MHDNHKVASADDIYRLMMLCGFHQEHSKYASSVLLLPFIEYLDLADRAGHRLSALETRVGGALLTYPGANSLLISPPCRYWKPHSGGTA